MCKIYNEIGCLSSIQLHLVKNNFDEFNSLDELINFQKDYNFKEQQITLNHKLLIQQEKSTLESDIRELNAIASAKKLELQQQLREKLDDFNQQIENLSLSNSKFIPILIDYYKNTTIWTKIWVTPIIFRLKLILFEHQSNKMLSKKNNHLQDIISNFENVVNQSSSLPLETFRRKKAIVNEINNSIYGAIGEQKVVNVLKNLPENYILINDFSCSFQPPLYHGNNDYIKSVQIDHLLISPSGIFVIETKNWSKYSIEKPYLFSPVQQVKRSGYAIYKIVVGEMNRSNLIYSKHNWGDRKIPVRNIIVFTNDKPTEEFQFVKILGLNELLGYIKYFTPCFSPKETQIIADYLLNITDRKEISSKLTIPDSADLQSVSPN
ncbi:MAG: nuclease-related domain-containing protein [Flavobacterium sp.]|uniref:nuclease-related domain-containing protein n=1 Tax=Flavobacterium sp. TaxID=239 RepID=UPI00326782C3